MRHGPFMFLDHPKIKATKTALKQWIKKPTVSPTTQRKQSTKQLLDLQMGLETQDISRAKIHREQEHQISTLRTFRGGGIFEA